MKTIDFRHFKIFTDITKSDSMTVSVALEFADSLYKNATGIMAHDLAFRIYKSLEPVQMTDEEALYITEFCKKFSTPRFCDSLEANIVCVKE